MKKFIFMIMALVATVTMPAQTVESSSLFENTYVSVGTGGSGWLQPKHNGYGNFWKSIESVSSVRLGKMITPTFGVELEGEVGMAYETTFVDHTNVGLNALFNVNNMVHPYRGEADKLEVVPFVGLGWYHTYGIVSNDLSGKGGVQLNWNLGEKQAWQLNVIPSITYIMTNDCHVKPKFDSRHAYVGLQVGVTYKFKNKKGTHNFELCPYEYTQAELDDLNAQINELHVLNENKDAELDKSKALLGEKDNEIAELKNRKMVTNVVVPSVVGFEIGKSEIQSTQRGNLLNLANVLKANEDWTITVEGHADAKTGTAERNQVLSEARAEAVKDVLVKAGVSADRITTVGKGDTAQLFEENDANRAVITLIK